MPQRDERPMHLLEPVHATVNVSQEVQWEITAHVMHVCPVPPADTPPPHLVHQQQLGGACDQHQQLAIGAPGSRRQASIHRSHLLNRCCARAGPRHSRLLCSVQQQQLSRGQGQAERIQLGHPVAGGDGGAGQRRRAAARLQRRPQVGTPEHLRVVSVRWSSGRNEAADSHKQGRSRGGSGGGGGGGGLRRPATIIARLPTSA